MKIVGALTILIFAIFLASVISLNIVIKKNIEKIESNIGKNIILQGDTLMVVDYSIINNSYTLEDGRSIDIKLVDKLKCIDEDM